MNFITYLLCWYAIAFGLYVLHVAWSRGRSGVSAHFPEPVMSLKERETIVAVLDEQKSIQFYIEIDIVDEKSYE